MQTQIGLYDQTQWQYLANAMPHLVWIAEPNGEVVYYNDRVSEFLGATFQDGVWKWKGLLHPEDQEPTHLAWERAVSTGTQYEISHRVQMKDGSFRWFLSRAIPEKDEQGRVRKWYGTATDIHQQKQYEEKIRESEERLASIFYQTSVGIAQCELNGKILLVNDRFCEITGRSADELYKLSVFDITHPDDLPKNEALMKGSIIALQPYEMEKRYLRPDGSAIWVVVNVSVIRDDKGEPKHLLGICHDITESKKAEEALKESEERFRIVSESAPNMVWSINPDGSIKFANRFTLDYLGIRTSSLRIHHILNFVHDEEKLATMEAVAGALREKIHYRIEHRLKGSDGEYRWFLSQGGPIFYPDGTLYGFVGSAIDIHDRKRFEDELHYQHQFTQTITDNAMVPLFMLDLKGFCTYLNPAAEKVFGYALDEVKNEPFHNYIHGTHPDGSPFPMNECRVAQAVFGVTDLREHEDVFVSKSGDFIPVKCSAKRIIKDGVTTGVLLEARDITAEKHAAKALQESEARFRSMADNISQLVWIADEKGNAFWYNQRWLEFAGISATDLQSSGWHEMIHADYAERVLAKFQRCITEGNPWEDTFPLKNREGYYRWFLTRATPIKDPEGKVIRWFGSNTDITERKETEEAIKVMADNLEKIVVQRTLELQRSNEDLQQFAHVASHDLKEPLRKIQMFANRLTEECGDAVGEKGAVYLEKISHATRRMFNMIDGVLSYSTVNASRQKPGSVDLTEVLRQIETDLEVVISEKSATIKYKTLPVVQGAGVLLYQLFYNLINNSLKFSRDKVAPVISVREEVSDDPDKIRLVLEDNGIGFEQEFAEKIFHTFTRLNSKDKYEGTGLGLSLCKKIAEFHNGFIEAFGVRDKGARFVITLPK